jgi:hypothetical protein
VLERFAGVDVWTEDRIRGGDESRQEIQRAIDQADVALLLLSADFLASDALLNLELPQIQRRHASGQLRVIPVLLRPSLWELHPWLKELHPLPKDKKPIGLLNDRDQALTEVVKDIVGLATTSMPVGPPNLQGGTLGTTGVGDGASVSRGVSSHIQKPAVSPGTSIARQLQRWC